MFLLGKSLGMGGLEYNQFSETPSQDAKEVAMTRRPGAESGILSPMDSSPLRGWGGWGWAPGAEDRGDALHSGL